MEFTLIFSNLQIIGCGLVLFSICWFANFMCSLYLNIGIVKEEFSWQKMWLGILKLFALIIGIGALVLAFTLIPVYLTKIGFPIPDEWTEMFTMLGLVSIVITSAATYGKEALVTISNIFKGGFEQYE
ncbi:MAG: hypothetical protein RR313_03680 [Anaerovoracaceae bacterium]